MKSATAVLLLMVVGAGCSRGRTEADVSPAPSTATPPPTTSTPPAPDTRAAEEEARRAETARRRAVLEERVFFEFDRADITDAARAVLDRKPAVLSDRSIRVRIDGHADERGSVEYNLALSLRRAHAVRSYLIDSGVAASQLEVAAFGEEQPLASGSNENAWAANRRAEFRILSGL